MTTIGYRLTAQEHGRRFEEGPIQARFDLPLGYERQKTRFIFAPSKLLAAIPVEDLGCGGQHRFVYVFRAADLLQEVRQVFALGEACQLRDVVQANIEQPADACASQF